MKKVLVVSYHFPPDPAIGSLRISGLAKYLPEFCWEPVILTRRWDRPPEERFHLIETDYHDVVSSFKKKIGLRPSLGVEKQCGLKIKKKKNPFSHCVNFIEEVVAYPDAHRGWTDYAVTAGDAFLRENRVDAILSTSFPVTCHIIAKRLSEKHGIPWVADLRDLWTLNHYYHYSRLRRLRERRLEVRTLSAADSLITVSEDLAAALRTLHRSKDVFSIPNGFDPEEMASESSPKTGKFTITYAGSLYRGRRDPAMLLRALHELILEDKIKKLDVEVNFFGQKQDWLEEEIKNFDLTDTVKQNGFISREESLTRQRGSQVLLLLLWDHPDETGVYTGKIFEYLTSKRPVLAVGGPKGVIKTMLKETNAGGYASTVEELKDVLLTFYSEYKTNGSVRYSPDTVNRDAHSQKEMARKFSGILNRISP